MKKDIYDFFFYSIVLLILLDIGVRIAFHYVEGVGVYKLLDAYFTFQVARDYKFPAFTYEFRVAWLSANLHYSVIFLIGVILIINLIFKNRDAKFILISHFFCLMVANVGNSIEYWVNGYVTNYIGYSSDGLYFSVYTFCDYLVYFSNYAPFALLSIYVFLRLKKFLIEKLKTKSSGSKSNVVSALRDSP